MHWSYKAGSFISTQPVEANGLIYWGSWDGYEHATQLDGTQVWQQSLGYTFSKNCNSQTGVASTATIASVMIGGKMIPVDFVGGGDAHFWALNASTGAVIWRTQLGTSPAHFIWSSPAVYNGNVYIGVASFGDCPLIRGKLIELNASTGAIKHTFYTLPRGCIGAGVWGSPTIDPADNAVYFATGNAASCSKNEPYSIAIVKLNATNLSFIDSWQVPVDQQTSDSDFGSTPTLFQASIGGSMHNLVGVANKNGVYYAFDRANLHQGPVWQTKIADSIGGGCGPTCGQGSISPSSWDGTTLFVAGGNTIINGNSCMGGLRALNPSNGSFIWEDCMNDGPVVGAVTEVPGVVVVGEGNKFVLAATSDGHTLFSYTDTNNGSHFYGAASISNGVLYIGNMDDTFYAFGT
jgi:polyvinyl alcohol dehydrogenase (cytochrome)